MALYHFSTKPLSRSTRNTVGAVAYRAGCKLQDRGTGENFNYRNKDVQYVELALPFNAPGHLIDLQQLIKENREVGLQALVEMAEAAEKRIDARVWREFEFALHRELSDEQNIALAKEFAQDQLCGRGMAVLLNFHFDRDEETGEYKPHCHALALTRPVTELGLSPKKEKEWNKREFLKDLREQWAQYSNFHLKLHGHEVQIDHRSYYERGIEIEPQPKRSRGVLEQEQRLQKLEGSSGPFTEKGQEFHQVQIRNLYRLLRRPELVFEIASKHHSTFMWGDVQKVLHRYVDDGMLFQKMDTRLKNSKELVLLEGEGIYTTRAALKAEVSLVEQAEDLASFPGHRIDSRQRERELISAYEKRGIVGGLSLEQERAAQHVLDSGQLKCLVGLAGSGKTTLLGICQEVWASSGYGVYGLAPTGKAAQNLSQSGIPSMTLHKFLKSFEDGRCQYNSKTVLVLDEAGMVDVGRFSKLLEVVQNRGVKLVVVGDGAQLQPVEAGPAFRLVTEHIGKAELTTVLRQEKSWQREATTLFGKGHAKEAVQAYQEKGHIHIVKEKVPSFKEALGKEDLESLSHLHGLSSYIAPRMYREMAREENPFKHHQDYSQYQEWKEIQKITGAYVKSDERYDLDVRKATKESLLKVWHTDFKASPEKSLLILAFQNKDVRSLNQGARFLLKTSDHIEKEEFTFKIKRESKDNFGRRRTSFEEKGFSKGDRIVFTRNNYGLGVRNGTIGIITQITSQKIQVALDEGKEVSFSPNLNPYFDHGWAITIHKSQGSTVDKAYVLASYEMTKNLTYVAMTRHREDVQVFGSSLDFWRPEKVSEILPTSGEKLAARDYLDSKSLETLMRQEDKLLSKVFTRISDELEAMGVVSKHIFWKVADSFLEREPSLQKRSFSDSLSKSIREETRAETLLPQKGYKGFWRICEKSSQLPEKSMALEKDSPQTAKKGLWRNPSSSGFQNELERLSPKTLDEMISYIKDKLHEIRQYESLYITGRAHEELHSYMSHIEKLPSLRQALYEHNHTLMKEAEHALKEPDHHVEHGHGKEMDFGM